MLLKVFTVYDAKVEAYMSPFFMNTRGEAMRGFSEVCQDGKSKFSKYPEDFILFEVGMYDDSTAQFIQTTPPVPVCKGLDFVHSPPPPLKEV